MAIEAWFGDVADRLRKLNLTGRELAILLAVGLVANLYFLSNFSPSIDDEFAALRGDPGVWLGQGRWTVYLIERFLFPQPAIPYAPYILLTVCQALAYVVVTRAHSYAVGWKTFACYPIFCAYPAWWFVSEFYSNVPAIGIALVLVAASAYLTGQEWQPDDRARQFPLANGVAIVVLLAVAIGAYQSMILLYICMVMGAAMAHAMRSDTGLPALPGPIARKIIRTFILAAAGVALYAAINHAIRAGTGAFNAYFDTFRIFDELHQAPVRLVTSIFKEAVQIYGGKASRFGASIPFAPVLLILSSLAIALVGRARVGPSLLLWAVILITPFALHFALGSAPIRAMLSLAYVTWLMGMVLLTGQRTVGVSIGTFVVLVYTLQILGLSSQYMASATISQAHDRMVAADIYRRIGELTADFDRNEPVEVDIYGHKDFSTIYASGWSSAMQGSFFAWDQGDLPRMLVYMRLMGYQPLPLISKSEQRKMTPLFLEMPVWPAAGCVRKVGNRYLVRLSRDPDPAHAGTPP